MVHGSTSTPDESAALQNRPSNVRHLLDIDDLSREEIVAILDLADHFKDNRPTPPLPLQGKVVGLFFFQSSTRTRVGFHAAAARLGATAIEVSSTRYEPTMSAPETALDTFRSVVTYCDLIVLRHKAQEELRRMASLAPIPVINGGCGIASHPTQTLLDLFFIRSSLGRLENLRIGIAGDLAGSRAARSLLRALRSFSPSEIRLMAPPPLQPTEQELESLPVARYKLLDSLEPQGLDIVYMAGFPRHRSDTTSEGQRRRYRLTTDHLPKLGSDTIILCPLPRIDEIADAIDDSPSATYFTQSQQGIFPRMAIVMTMQDIQRQTAEIRRHE